MAKNFRKSLVKRTVHILLAICLLLAGSVGRIFYIQIVKGEEYAAKAESQQLSDTEVEAMRGTIYDNDGNVLAQSATVWTVYIDPANIEDDERELIVEYFTEQFELDDEEQAELIEKSQSDSRYYVVETKVENSKKEEISAFVSENKLTNCIGFTQSAERYYPYGSLASTVLGFVGSDNQGLAGIESYYNEELTGINGRIITATDAKSNSISADYETSVEAQDGYSLKLTINSTIQYYLEKGLQEALDEYQAKGCYGIVMNVNTGAVLAMASLPDYDCNDPYTITYSKYLDEIENAESDEEKVELQSAYRQNQWRNFTVSDTYVPGSVCKTFIASAALEEDVVSLDTTYTCTGSIQVDTYTMNCHYHAGHGTQTLTQGLENSCNPFFITIGQKLGVHNYFKYFTSFGFTEKTGIDLPGEASSQYYEEDEYGIVELSSASFGQTNSVTPIQLCTALCAVANGGTLYQPYLVSEIVDSDGNTVAKTESTAVRNVISEETSETVCSMLESVVENGTGKNAYVAGYSVGGKTGTSTKLGETSENEKDKYIVSFACIAPSDDPEIAMIIICDEPNQDLGGGAICAPIAASVVEAAMDELGIEPSYTEDELETLSTQTPSLIGESLSSAKETLENAGLTYKVMGSGDTVTRQSPSALSSIPSGGVVVLYTDSTEKETVEVPDFSGYTITEVNKLAASYNLNIEIAGNDTTSSLVIAYKQSESAGNEVEVGSVITVTFKSTEAVLD
ncbi:MAG: PASTA domain-containing protein [Clostridiales bacterium]|nr:PASTA domain-containing protein [Clostridiales bacterium]